ncbi:MAG TPA: hypothetical protein VNT32_08895 [Thermoleophilaceae bacterium]|nr:hypothetical protein [Thermoleophilaceae bacterium]
MGRGKALAILGGALCAAVGSSGSAQAAAAPSSPVWMKSEEIRERIDAAGSRGATYAEIEGWVRNGLAGQDKRDEPVADPCPTVEPGTRPGSIHTNACITYPYGCTANFILHKGSAPFTGVSDGRNYFIGTAGHCTDHAGQPVYMDNGAGLVVRAGEVAKRMNGGPGNDFAAVRIDAGLPVDPRMPGIGGPRGIYEGCAPGQTITWWGHGYGVAVGQGNKGTGVVTGWWDRVFGWDGDALPGDSGSGVVLDASLQAAGNLTHLVIDPRYFPAVNAGTRMTRALLWLGGDFFLVNEDGSYSSASRNTGCGNPNNGR